MTRDVPSGPKNLSTESTQSGGYNLTFTTRGHRYSAKSIVFTFRLLGSLLNTGVHEVSSKGQGSLDPGKVTMLSYPTLPYIGDICGIEVGVNATVQLFSCCSQWPLESVAVHCLASDMLYTFHAKPGDGGIKRGSQTLFQYPSVRSNVGHCLPTVGCLQPQ
jgi:hypothetical protein